MREDRRTTRERELWRTSPCEDGAKPTLIQHIFRLFALAPDWTESNIQSIKNAFTGGSGGSAGKKAYQRLVIGWYLKALAATALLNYALAGGDPDKMWENYKRAWNQGNLNFLKVNVTPIYKFFGGMSPGRLRYFPIIGHMLDPIRLLVLPPH